MMNLNPTRLQAVIQEAFDKTNNLRWQMAISKAKVELESNPFMHYDGHALLILSDSNEIYSANGTCQCKAYAHHQPCWHRAAARLVIRYMEATQAGGGRGCCFMCDGAIAADDSCACSTTHFHSR